MRRRTLHTAFAASTLACACAAAVPAWRWLEAARINAAVAEAQRPIAAGTGDRAVPAARGAPPSVRLARATTLAAAGAYDAAFKSYAALIQDSAGQPIAADVLFNLGNMYLRQALRVPPIVAAAPAVAAAPSAVPGSDPGAATPALQAGAGAVSPVPTVDAPAPMAATTLSPEAAPLVELAKQRYRDLLRIAPDGWDARYNLERALRLAPEEEPPAARDANVPAERRQVMLRGMEPGDLP